MSPSSSPANWKRLGEQLTRRRVELDPRFSNRGVFAAERAIDYRLAYDVEEARRVNFRPATLAHIAAAYAVTPESITGALAGGSLEPLGPRLSAVPTPAPLHAPGDMAGEAITLLLEDYPSREWWQFLAAIWRLPQDDKLPLLLQALHSRQPRPESGAPRGERNAGPVS
jgi:hypothetical protein